MTKTAGPESDRMQALSREFDDLCQMLRNYGRQVPNEVRSALLQLDRLSEVLLPLGESPVAAGTTVKFVNDRHVEASPAAVSKAASEPAGIKLDDAIGELLATAVKTEAPAPKKAGKKGSKKDRVSLNFDPNLLLHPKDIIIEGVSIPGLAKEAITDSKESSDPSDHEALQQSAASIAQASLTRVPKFVQDSINMLGLHQYH